MKEQLIRTQMLLGEDAMTKLNQSHVAVVGLGGVGGYAVEALVRSGVGKLTLIDHDTISVSNLNRQIGALHSTIGRSKAEALAARVRDISPGCEVAPLDLCYSAETREELFSHSPDFIVDAIDLVTHKLDLICTAVSRNIPIISALGTGNKLDATALTVTDISKTYNCPLAKVIRKELRARGINHLPVLFSPEEKREADQMETPPDGRRSIPGSVAWVPGCAGLMIAGEVVLRLCDIKKER
ncbi:MAG: tRNA threonylcarbamoyladenosine dehydratase [Ruminococcaceae bacterium]|nr:tRNA threonylcarbamoyladenosine dehydratase [Oscillospiraceae bacterium]